ncbi:MAG: hypothetical protein ABSA17_02490 [Rhabdochlamydiaceae bacterium]
MQKPLLRQQLGSLPCREAGMVFKETIRSCFIRQERGKPVKIVPKNGRRLYRREIAVSNYNI